MAISDIVNPQVLSDLTSEKLANMLVDIPGLFTSREFPIGAPGTSWEIPYNKLLDDLIMDGESVTLVPQALKQGSYKSVVQRAARAWKDEDIASMVATGDPAMELSTRMAEVAKKYMMLRMLDVLDGAVPAANRNVAAGGATDDTVRDTKFKLGDKANDLKYILVNSNVYKQLEDGGYISWQAMNNIIPISGASLYGFQVPVGAVAGGLVPTVAGLILIVSDNISAITGTLTATKYPSYLLGQEAMGLYYQKKVTVATQREELIGGGYDAIVERVNFVMTLHGVSYDQGSSPQLYDSSSLRTKTNYTLKWDQKNVKAAIMVTD